MAGTTIYGLVDSRTGVLRYVGKTVQRPERRLQQHRCDALRRASNHKDRWMNLLFRNETPPLLVVIETQSSWERECFRIAHYRAAGVPLLNGNDGGEGQKRSPGPETRAKMSAAMTGRVRTPEHNRKLGDARRGKKASAETREKLRLAHLGQRPTNIDQLRQINKGRPIPPEQRALIAASMRKVWEQRRQEK